MSETAIKPTLVSRLKLSWFRLLRGILHLWVRTQVLPDHDGQTGLPKGQPVCYVMDSYALSSVLILDKACETLGIDRPLAPINGLAEQESRAYAVLRRMVGLFIRRPSTRRNSEVLKRLVEVVCENPDQEVLLVPVTVLVGRAPDKETGLAKILFAEDWEVAGRFRRLISTLINGRDTVVQFSKPVSLRALAAEQLGAARSLRKVSRVLRVHFRSVKDSVIGPDLSHRRTLVDALVNAPSVQEAIEDKCRRENISTDKATRIARLYALEIAANYSYTFIRFAWVLITWFTEKIYSGLRLYHFDRFKQQAVDYEVIYVPCHRSHVDYLLLSFLLYKNGLVPPHVAAGVNLNLPVVGSFLRRGGAFFLRRTFKAQKLYSAVFNEYVSQIFSRGVSIEYFIEGTRSRTGRLLQPKGGMLAMTVKAYLRTPVRPIMFQPVYLGYEQLVEGSSYTHELSGASKKSESLFDLFKVFRVLRKEYGQAHISFGQPIFLDTMLDRYDPAWREASQDPDARLGWMTPLVNELGEAIMTRINQSANVNPVNLLAMTLLATPKHAIGEQELVDQLTLYVALLSRGPFGEDITITQLSPAEIIEYGFKLGLLQRKTHVLGDIIALAPEHAVSLTYFRNNATHLFAIPALVACCFLKQRSLDPQLVHHIAADVYPFLKVELFLPWPAEQLASVVDANLQLLESLELISHDPGEGTTRRTEGGTEPAGQLTLLAGAMLQTLERYYITFAVLVKNGSGTLSRAQLERLCIMTAQRISLLHEFEAPEFYERALFKQFIGELRRNGVLVANQDDKLEFGQRLEEIGEHARYILAKEIRHGIIRVAPQLLGESDSDT